MYVDLCRLMQEMFFSYFLTFTDDHSRYGHVYLLKYKSEVFEKFKEYKSEVENQLGQSIKVLRSDRGGEYLSQEFQDYLKEMEFFHNGLQLIRHN